MKQNQHKIITKQNPEHIDQHNNMPLNSKCKCPPCQSKPQKHYPSITFDQDLNYLQKNNKSSSSNFVYFLNQLYEHSSKIIPHLPILDTIVFNPDGSIKFVLNVQNNKLKMYKLFTPLKNYIFDRKYYWDLEYQKKKYQRQHMGFSFVQLDHTSQKLIKQFQNNIKFTNSAFNRCTILKNRGQSREQILTSQEMTNIFVKIQRKLFDFSKIEYLQIFPIMYGEEQNSYLKTVKYFRNRECLKKNYKTAEHYVSNWISKNDAIQELQGKFIDSLSKNEDDLLMYQTYKLFIFFQQISNKQIDQGLLSFISNDQGHTFYLKNIQSIKVNDLHKVQDKIQELPKKLQETMVSPILLPKQMKGVFSQFQKNFTRLEAEHYEMEEKQRKDIEFSNQVYESLGYTINPKKKKQSFINSIWSKPENPENAKIQLKQ